MTPNIAGSLFNVLLTAFFLVVLLGVGIGVYAAAQLKKIEQASAPSPDDAETDV